MEPRSTLVPPTSPGAVRYARRVVAPMQSLPRVQFDDDWGFSVPILRARGER